jgi:CheY-like chemotaxis protein
VAAIITPAPLTRPLRLLVVDDSSADVLLLNEAIVEHGLRAEMQTAADGDQAIAHLRGAQPRPDLILLDLNMPRRNGREVLREIKADPSLRTIPVIIFSTSSSPSDIEDCYANHANSYLVKPVDFDALGDIVRALDAFWHRQAELPGIPG